MYLVNGSAWSDLTVCKTDFGRHYYVVDTYEPVDKWRDCDGQLLDTINLTILDSKVHFGDFRLTFLSLTVRKLCHELLGFGGARDATGYIKCVVGGDTGRSSLTEGNR